MADDLNDLLMDLQGPGGGGKSLFDSPMGGDDAGSVAPIQTGLELVLVNDATALCRGKVGETKMCICLDHDCETKSHKRNRVPLSKFPSSRFLLVGSGPSMSWGFLAPVLDATALEDTMVDSLLSRVKEDWAKLFELVAVEGVTDVETETSLKDLTQTVRKTMLVGTPNAKRAADDRLYGNYLESVKKAKTILMEGLTAQRMSAAVVESRGETGLVDETKMVEFFDAIAKRIDLVVGYSMGLDRVLELMHGSVRSEILGLEDDVWLVNNYQHPEHITVNSGSNRQTAFQIKNPAKILVCKPGSYSEETHGRLFDAFRNLLIRRARRNAFRGLAAYLRDKHGSQTVEFTVKYHKKNTSGSRNTRRRRKKRKRNSAVENTEGPEPTVTTPISIRLPRDEGRRIAFGLSGRRKVSAPSWTFKPHKPADPKKKAGSANDPRVELHKDLTVGRDALSRLANSSWWSWDHGSTLFFWRWPARYRKAIWDGTKLFVKKELLPHHFKRQLWPSEESQRSKMAEKIGKVRSRGYILPGEVNSLTGFFAVPKGEDDIRIVYDATACGLNAALWAPNFALPSIDSVLRNADSRTWFSDIDLGEMFLNYFLDEDLREYAGVDVREIGGAKWERWERTLMGFRPSPYVCTQTFSWGEDSIKGDCKDRDNPFRWDTVRMNLPGDEEYDPAMPWVYKWDERNDRLASHFSCYIDDIRGMGGTEGVCRQATRRVASWINYLGQQDAPRKRRPPSRTPGAWAGAMCLSKEDGLYVTCTQKKWEKAKAIVEHWHQEVCVGRARSVNAAQMERDVGFLVHLSRTFPAVFPYLKGFYLSLNSWRKGRNDEGWKYSMAEWRAALDLDDTLPSYRVMDEARRLHPSQSYVERPEMVDAVPRLGMDLKAIQELLKGDQPVHRLVRGDKVRSAKFAFGDASGGGFGSSWEVGNGGGKDCNGINYRFGTWDKETSKESSNYRELRNLTETLEMMAEDGTLAGTELFLFTDNSTAESAFDKGSSSSRMLFELVLRLRTLEMSQSCKIHLSHVSGKRMIDQGSDGLSRGNLAEGVMRGADMKGFIPINKTAFEREPKLKKWLNTWTQSECTYLDPAGWYTTGQELVEAAWEVNSEGRRLPVTRPGTFVWSPPPVAAGIAMEELRRSRHKSEKSTHVVIVPRLFTTEWRKQLHKAADLVLTLPAGHPAWPTEMHEPLTIGILFPFLSHRPWQLRRTPKLLELGNALQKVWESGQEPEGPLLRELWNFQRTVEGLSPSMASDMLYGKSPG